MRLCSHCGKTHKGYSDTCASCAFRDFKADRRPKDNPEKRLQTEIINALSEMGILVFRNNVGFAKAEQVKFGLCKGSSDLIGLTKNGRFFALEVKSETGHLSKDQIAFLDAIRKSGGIAACVRSVEDAIKAVFE